VASIRIEPNPEERVAVVTVTAGTERETGNHRRRLLAIVASTATLAAAGLATYAWLDFRLPLPAAWNISLASISIAAVVIFVLTYIVLAIGKLPGFHLDRAGAALLGASLMVGCDILSLGDAWKAIDLDTIALLLGMMIVVANLRLSGVFRWVTNVAMTRARYPFLLLAAVALISGIFSAFLVNDTICLVLTPLVLDLTLRAPRPRPLSPRRRDGIQRRQHGDAYRKPAEHLHRQRFAYQL
jgi:Citrate transporter